MSEPSGKVVFAGVDLKPLLSFTMNVESEPLYDKFMFGKTVKYMLDTKYEMIVELGEEALTLPWSEWMGKVLSIDAEMDSLKLVFDHAMIGEVSFEGSVVIAKIRLFPLGGFVRPFVGTLPLFGKFGKFDIKTIDWDAYGVRPT